MAKPLINWSPKFYDRISKKYDLLSRVFFSMGEKGKERVVINLRIGSILDIACGSGGLLKDAVGVGARAFGSDTSWGMLTETRFKAPSANLVQASFYELPFKGDTFDTVVETNAVSGVEIESDIVLSEMVRLCKPGGEIRIGDYAKAPKDNLWQRFMEWIGVLFGDYPHDYVTYFRARGLQTEVEYLGFDGMYQYVRAEKAA
ncbi:MAG: methyltransferase domain-containing protein [Anaerolineales bacterium]|nr:methyltransferase domain-containing protein [Chloroflexota bacterium]MBL6981900.1 methyltransferase domain-containing protein [Anaerolineales bacterium]